jgi:hypothetical protein
MQWNPGDLAHAGMMVGWLMSLGLDFRHPSGSGETTTLQVGAARPIEPGEWVVQDYDGVRVMTDQQFRELRP